MQATKTKKTLVALLLVLAAAVIVAFPAFPRAHCDTLDGPVVVAARHAIETGKVEKVLGWVLPDAEKEIRDAFKRTLAVRKASPEAKALADVWFFETLVRVHREGEGAPYTGLKPAGLPVAPAIAAADHAVESGSAAELEQLLVEQVRHGLHEKFHALNEKTPGKDASVADVRAWVAKYVTFIHYAEGIHAATAAGAHGHGEAPATSAAPHADAPAAPAPRADAAKPVHRH
jgi:hypothetical protein